MPSDLEEFFGSLLTRLDKIYKLETSQVLRLAMKSLGRIIIHDSLDNWLDFWLLKDLDFSDVNFAIEMSVRFYDLAQITEMRDDTRVFINASCRDFLSVSAVGRTVTFLHRTVYDFLSSTEIQNLLNTQVPPIFQDPKFLIHIRLARCKIFLTKTEFGNKQCCYGASEPPDTPNNDRDEDLVFPGSTELAGGFEATMSALLSACEDANGDHHPSCVFTQDWDEIYRFLVANGKFSAILKIAETHDLQHTAAPLIGIAQRFPRESKCDDKGRDDQDRKIGSAKLPSSETSSSEAFILKLQSPQWGCQQDSLALADMGTLEHFTSAELEYFTLEELKLLEAISAEDIELW